MEYWKKPTGEIYWGDQVHPGDIEISEAEGLQEKLRQDRENMSISPSQGLATLNEYGYIDQVEELMSDPSTPWITKMAFERTGEWRRTSPMIQQMLSELGLSDEMGDEMFNYAKTLDF